MSSVGSSPAFVTQLETLSIESCEDLYIYIYKSHTITGGGCLEPKLLVNKYVGPFDLDIIFTTCFVLHQHIIITSASTPPTGSAFVHTNLAHYGGLHSWTAKARQTILLNNSNQSRESLVSNFPNQLVKLSDRGIEVATSGLHNSRVSWL